MSMMCSAGLWRDAHDAASAAWMLVLGWVWFHLLAEFSALSASSANTRDARSVLKASSASAMPVGRHYKSDTQDVDLLFPVTEHVCSMLVCSWAMQRPHSPQND